MTRRATIIYTILISITLCTYVSAQEFHHYYCRNQFLQGPATAYGTGLLGFANPANTVMLQQFNTRFYWTEKDDGEPQKLESWGVFSAFNGFGFAMQEQTKNGREVRDYNMSLAFGDRSGSFGLGYTWSGRDADYWNHEKLFSLGMISRPFPSISIAASGHFSTETSAREGVVELGIRPLGNNRLTVFGDAVWQKRTSFDDALWSSGASVELVEGINLVGRYFRDESFTVGMSFNFDYSKLTGQAHFDADQEIATTTYGGGFGDYVRNPLLEPLSHNSAYASLKLKGRVDYLKYTLFDDNTHRFKELLDHIQNVKNDPRISAITLNLSAMQVLPEHAWELREALKEVQAVGKKVIIFIDNVQMTNYHLASVADVLMLDPQGSIILPGYLMNRTYLRGTLEKMGLSFDEWRFFTHKSAAETYSRDSMSEADSTQRQELVNDIYALTRSDVSSSRDFSHEEFDGLVNDNVFFTAKDALKAGLVDTLCRWNSIDGIVAEETGSRKTVLPVTFMSHRANVYREWGEPPAIALVYALGVCAMDQGIRARWLGEAIRSLQDNRRVKAVVLRVDSPGGDAMASDVVAEAIRSCAQSKPVIISQGQVAASGGYWISMYGDKIFAGPGTITGSIGVIGGWIYDSGLSDKLGMTADHVKVGEHADLTAGIRLPLFGLQVPERNLNPEERAQVEQIFRALYDEFLEKVALGRNMSVDSVAVIAEGRVYSGIDGKDLSLVDELGGMQDAINYAKEMAGFSDDDYVEVIDLPSSKGLFDSNAFSPIGVVKNLENDPTIQFIKLMTEQPGYPRPILLPGDYPELD